jgi:hemerythrin
VSVDNVHDKLISIIEDALSHNMKGKRNSTKAKVLMEALFNGNVLNGEVAKWMNKKIKCHISALFHPWRLV